jgi:hypothetical protein
MTRARQTTGKDDAATPSVGSRLRALEARLPAAMAHDRYHVGREIGHIRYQIRKRRRVKRLAARLQEIEQRLVRSAQTRSQRQAATPAWEPLASLPITAHQAAIVDAIQAHPVVIVAGETGSGKTTQLPKFCLAAGRGAGGLIGCTQPRRIAATTVAQRIADELGEPLGNSVGYKIRFQDRTRPAGFIKVMTDGILLAEAQGDPALTAYDTLIVDEAHERSLNIDFILGILKKLVQRRKDLKLIITSATIDTEKFARAFDDAPIIEVSGRMYPVEVRYRPIPERRRRGGGRNLRRGGRRGRGDPRAGKRPRRYAGVHAHRAGYSGNLRVVEARGLPKRRSCRSMPAWRPLTSAACLRAAGRARSSWPPTWRKPRSPFRASATWWTPAWPASPAIRRAPAPRPCRWHPSPAAAPTSAWGAAGAWQTASASGSTTRRITRGGRDSRRRKSCGPTWPRSSCG